MTKYRIDLGWTGKWELQALQENQIPAWHSFVPCPYFNTPQEALDHFLNETKEAIKPCEERLFNLYQMAIWAKTELEKSRC